LCADLHAGKYIGLVNISSNPTAAATGRWMGNSDIQYPMNAKMGPDGSVIISMEEDLFQKGLVYHFPPGYC
jgi:hypothetical protein